ncbi:hypothetical protein BpHYR1_028791 [Brachionus plicatilis]|uniref:Uncharacterized protein n=1 Tax=Brachionus plicatilis TaxID=10195 RepID=A0A3M7RCE9_BRAPC|nr:hypothetical protein BpHYR1_028791 [Brachionus plicatilis]
MTLKKRGYGLTISVHACLDTFLKSTRSALIAMGLVHLTSALALVLAHVLTIATDGALEKAGATVARKYAVMFAARVVVADFARHVCQYAARWCVRMVVTVMMVMTTTATTQTSAANHFFFSSFFLKKSITTLDTIQVEKEKKEREREKKTKKCSPKMS